MALRYVGVLVPLLDSDELKEFKEEVCVKWVPGLGEYIREVPVASRDAGELRSIVHDHFYSEGKSVVGTFTKYLMTDRELTDDDWCVLGSWSEDLFGVIFWGKVRFARGDHGNFKRYRRLAQRWYHESGTWLSEPLPSASATRSTMRSTMRSTGLRRL